MKLRVEFGQPDQKQTVEVAEDQEGDIIRLNPARLLSQRDVDMVNAMIYRALDE